MFIEELLRLKPLKEHKLLAGQSGLYKRVTNINVYEYKLIENRDRSGELYITSCFSIGGNLNAVFEMVLTLIETNSPGLIINDEVVKNLNPKTERLANDNDFPIILIPNHIMYSSIISAFYNKNIIRENSIKERLILQIFDLGYQVEKCLTEINPSFRSKFLFVYVASEYGYKNFVYESLSFVLRSYIYSEVVFFKEGTMLIITNDDGKFDYETISNDIIDVIGNNKSKISFNYSIGFSSSSNVPCDAKKLIEEAIYAQIYQNNVSQNKYSKFEEIGRYRILIPMIKNPEIIEYVESVMDIIKENDIKYKDSLYETLLTYRNCNLDIKVTAKKMFVHNNTIRYRLRKMEALVENKIDSIHELCMFSDLLDLKRNMG